MQCHDPDGAEAHDDDGRAWRNGGAQRPEVTGGKDVGEEHRLFVGDAVGDGQGEEVGEGDRHRLGLAAGKIGHRPKCSGHAVEADVGLAGEAGTADATPDHARDEHAVAWLQGAYVGANLGHRADGLVPETDAVAGRGVVVQVQIRSADGRALDSDDDTLGPRQHRIGNVLDRDGARPGKDSGSHLRTLPRRTRMSRAEFRPVRAAIALPEIHVSDTRTQHHRRASRRCR